jgi:hypothetical protein
MKKDDDTGLVCMRVADMPIPSAASVIGRCDECDERIWIAHTSPRTDKRFCVACAKAMYGKPKMEVTKRSLAEAVDYLRRKGQIV